MRSGSSGWRVVGGSLGGVVALEVGLVGRPQSITSCRSRRGSDSPMAIMEPDGVDDRPTRGGRPGLARQLAMTTYRSEADFDERFSRTAEADGRPSIVSYLDHRGAAHRAVDGDTYRVMAGAMDRHDIGAGRGGIDAAHPPRGRRRPADRDRHRRRHPAARVRSVDGRGRVSFGSMPGTEIESTKGHDAFLVEWISSPRCSGSARSTGQRPAPRSVGLRGMEA
jgi:homoserine O-acetyltransferase